MKKVASPEHDTYGPYDFLQKDDDKATQRD